MPGVALPKIRSKFVQVHQSICNFSISFSKVSQGSTFRRVTPPVWLYRKLHFLGDHLGAISRVAVTRGVATAKIRSKFVQVHQSIWKKYFQNLKVDHTRTFFDTFPELHCRSASRVSLLRGLYAAYECWTYLLSYSLVLRYATTLEETFVAIQPFIRLLDTIMAQKRHT